MEVGQTKVYRDGRNELCQGVDIIVQGLEAETPFSDHLYHDVKLQETPLGFSSFGSPAWCARHSGLATPVLGLA